MPSYPSLPTDKVLYLRSDVYADADIKLTLLDGSILDIWGTMFINGNPIVNIGALPIATQAEAEAGVDNTKVMTPLRSKQANQFQCLMLTGGTVSGLVTVTNNLSGTALAVNNSVDRGISVLSSNAGLRLMRTLSQTPYLEFYSNDGLTLFGFAQAGASGLTLAGGNTVGLTLTNTGVTANIPLFVPVPTAPLHAATKGYVDSLNLGSYLPLAGGTLTGNLTMTDGTVIQVPGSGTLALAVAGPTGQVRFITNGSTRFTVNDSGAFMSSGRTFLLAQDPVGALEATTKQYVDVGDALFTSSVKGTVPGSGGGTSNYLRADGTWASPAAGAGITDGDKGDIVVSGSGAVWTIDNSVVSNAKMAPMNLLSIKGNATGSSAIPTDLSQTAVKNMLALNLVDNTADNNKPLFTTSIRGLVPPPTTASGKFLMDDGTWTAPGSSLSGVGGVFPFTYNTSTAEPPIGNQLRGNNATFASSTKLWIMETTTDGLDVTVGLGRIKAGFQLYVQDYDNSTIYAIWNVTADATDKGTYWEVTVTPVSSAGTMPGGKIALQSLSAAQASNLFSTTTTAAGLAPGSNGAGATAYLNGAGAWTVPASGGVTDGDKGDIVVSGSGASWLFDSAVVTTAAKTVLDDTTVAAMLATLGGVGPNLTQTLTQKTISLGNNFVDGASSEWNAACLDTDFYFVGQTDVAVTDGGTGKSSSPAYQVIVGGTSSTGAFQSVAPSASGFLKTTSTTAVPTWASVTKTDVGLANVDNTSDATKDSATATLTNKTLTDPKINLSINAQTGTSYTLVLADNCKVVTCNNAAAISLQVPTNASVAFPVGAQITIIQTGAGKVTVSAVTPGTTTVNATPSGGFRAQHSGATLIKLATDTWALVGDLS